MADLRNAKQCYDSGAEAKRKGWSRVTPYYEAPRSDYWWLAGYDGVDFYEAEAKQPEFEPHKPRFHRSLRAKAHDPVTDFDLKYSW